MEGYPDAKKVAFVHDFLVSYGGAERVLESLLLLYPEAPVYTLLYDKEAMGERFSGRDIRVSFLGKFPKILRRRYRWLLPFFPVAIETFDLRDFDLVISSSGAWGKGIVTRLHTIHIAYLHSPMRFLWDANERYLDMVRVGFGKRFFVRLFLSFLRVWDKEAADRPDVLVANSQHTRSRIQKYYRRESSVIYPPVHIPDIPPNGSLLQGKESVDFFLIVARLSESKGLSVAIEAFNKLGLPLWIVGEGKDHARLERMAGENISFLGHVSDAELHALYTKAQALIMPSEEDFGMVAAESLAASTPVIALGRGGALEIVEPGVTGEFFFAETSEVLADAIRRFLDRGRGRYTSGHEIVKSRFSKTAFLSEWRSLIDETMKKHGQKQSS